MNLYLPNLLSILKATTTILIIDDPEFIKDTVNDVYAIARKNVEEGKELPRLFSEWETAIPSCTGQLWPKKSSVKWAIKPK